MNTNAILRRFHLSTCLFTHARTHTPPCFSEKYCTFDTDIKYGALMHYKYCLYTSNYRRFKYVPPLHKGDYFV